MNPDIQRTIDAVWRVESARLIASLSRMVQDVGLAEDLAQSALVAALEQWPEQGLPEKPGAWQRSRVVVVSKPGGSALAFRPVAGLEIMNVFANELKEKK